MLALSAAAQAAPTTIAPDPTRSHRPENHEGKVPAFYGFLYVTDKYEGLILVGAATILLQALLPPDLRVFREAFVFVAVTLVLLFRPQGLIPARGLKERI